MKKKEHHTKFIVFGISFLLLALTLPAISWSPEGRTASPEPAVTAAPAKPASVPAAPVKKLASPEEIFEEYVEDIFDEMDLRGKGMKLEVFKRALTGYQNLKQQKLISPNKSIISIVDFSKASRYKRLWVLDLQAKKVLFHSYVAHGRGSGDDKPYAFSNKPNSHQSSLGFYITAGTYFGKHGLSLKLNGLDAGFNTNAYERAIVVHGASYVSKDFIKQHGRLGRSHGCPALPEHLTEPIINTIKDKSLMYIDAGIDSYSSVYLNKNMAATHYAGQSGELKSNI